MLDKLIDLILNAAGLFKFWVVVREYERGVVLRLGRFNREIEPGFHWVWPMSVDEVLTDNVVPRTYNLGAQSLTTNDGKCVTVGGVVTASIRNIRKALLEVEGVDHALVDSCSTVIARFVAQSTWDQLMHGIGSEKLTADCREIATDYGIKIVRVQLADCSVSRAIRLHTTQSYHSTPMSS